MKANEYLVLTDTVSSGIDAGWRRAFKHTDNPSEEIIKKEIYDAVILAVTEYFVFDDQNTDKQG